MTKVSVVMPCLNAMKYLKECLESVLSQTLKEIEIIIVDAGSTDGTREMLNAYAEKDDRIRLIDSEKKSMGAQYNLGISVANGKYVGFVEMDDYIAPDMYETLYYWAEDNNVEYVKSDCNMFFDCNGERVIVPFYIIPLQNSYLVDNIINIKEHKEMLYMDVFMWSGIYRRDFLNNCKIRLNETKGAAYQDYGFIFQVDMLSKAALYKRGHFYQYRRDNESSSSYSRRVPRFIVDELKYMLNFFNKHPEMNDFRPYYCRRVVNSFFSSYRAVLKNGGGIKEVYDEIVEFRNYLVEEWKQISQQDKLKATIWYDIGIRLFLQSIETYHEYAVSQLKMENESFDKFIEEISHSKEIVIVGCGERGKLVLVFLKRHNICNNIVFADNNEQHWNNNYMGHKICSVEEAVKNYPSASYIVSVANLNVNMELRRQLRNYGILEKQIYVGIGLYPYQVTDIGGKLK